MYVITEDFYNAWASILGDDFPIGTICNQDEDGTLHHIAPSKGAHTEDGGPVLPPPKTPPIIP